MLTQVSGYNVRWCGTHTYFEDDPVKGGDEAECAICLSSIGQVNCCTTECGHNFCLACLIKHSKGDPSVKCPLCRQKVTDSEPCVQSVPPPRVTRSDTDLARELFQALLTNPRTSSGVQVSRDLHARTVEYTRRIQNGWTYRNGMWSIEQANMEWGF